VGDIVIREDRELLAELARLNGRYDRSCQVAAPHEEVLVAERGSGSDVALLHQASPVQHRRIPENRSWASPRGAEPARVVILVRTQYVPQEVTYPALLAGHEAEGDTRHGNSHGHRVGRETRSSVKCRQQVYGG